MLKKKFAPSFYEMADAARSIALNYFRTNVASADKADKNSSR
ncbi:MAG: hypothetical protein PHD48_06665 [Alphaproteobacteria bacterium]|nr:hypothetical protein [Alphaproteobacteria bacterium]